MRQLTKGNYILQCIAEGNTFIQEIKNSYHVENIRKNRLPYLAWAFSVDTWDDNWPEEIKRQVIVGSLQQHRIKGTKQAVTDVLQQFGIKAEILEWWQENPKSKPHTFTLTTWLNQQITDLAFDKNFYQSLLKAIDSTKPLRSHYSLQVGVGLQQTLKTAMAFSSYQISKIDCQAISKIKNYQTSLYYAQHCRLTQIICTAMEL